jgi:predicted ATPase
MIRTITFLQDFRCFKIGDSFEFRPGVNLLVGDQGVGKSSLFQAIKNDLPAGYSRATLVKMEVAIKNVMLHSFDFERDNPRMARQFFDDNRMMAQVVTMFKSHGQTVKAIVGALEQKNPDSVIVMDEPDMALSIRSCYELSASFSKLANKGLQIICTAHNPILIASQYEVLSLEHRKWMKSSEFIGSHSPPEERV